MHMFSRERKRFILIDESSVEELEAEVRGNYAEKTAAIGN
jgi:hypothetical protein